MQKCDTNDVTEYARSLGYDAQKPVRVLDGLVVSHRNADWFIFCDRLRKQSEVIQLCNKEEYPENDYREAKAL